jgi:exodeoxyribonuclease VII large subunit
MSQKPKEQRRTIAQVNQMVKGIVEVETLEHFFWVGGKVERYYKSNIGHVYFNLVDGRTQVRCMLADRETGHIDFDIKNGIEIELYGDVQVYEDRAEINIKVLNARLIEANEINTLTGIQQLKQDRLYPKPPKPVPNPIRYIGIITSKSSHAVGDFEATYQIAGQTAVLAPVQWHYVILEGDRAVETIVDAIQKFSLNPDIDIIGIIRGGGRYLNLAVFDDVDIARAIAKSPKYVVTGIGHHKDSTLADQVSDYSASTPTSVANYIANLCFQAQAPHNDLTPSTQSTSYFPILMALVGLMFVIIVILLLLNFQ